MAQKKRAAARASSLGYPGPPTGLPKQTGGGYPPPQTGGHDLHLQPGNFKYPQPNSANNPDPASGAGPGSVPGADAYRPSLAGNDLGASTGTPGVISGDEPPDYPS